MPSYRQLLCSCLFGALLPSLMAVEPIAVAGKIVKTNDLYGVAFFALQSIRNGNLVAVLQGQDLGLRADQSVILQAETTGLSYLGLPILNVVDVLPEYWELPPIWNHYAKGFGAYSGFGQELRANDYASAPYEEKRAYDLDNSQVLSSFTLSTSAIALPPVVLQVTRASTGVAISWNAVSGIRYDLISSSNVAGPYLFTTNIFSFVSGQISLTLPSTNQTQFYRLHY